MFIFPKYLPLLLGALGISMFMHSTVNAGTITNNFNQNANGTALVHGTIVAAGNTGLVNFGGFTVTGNNTRSGHDRDWIVAFDTELTGTRDTDLQRRIANGRQQWIGGNFENSSFGDLNNNFGKALIIQEYDVGLDTAGGADGIIDEVDGIAEADDEGGRPSGYIDFEFDEAINRFGFDFIDAENAEKNGYTLEFFDSLNSRIGSKVLSFAEFASGGAFNNNAVFGDGTINRIAPITLANLNSFLNTSVQSFQKVRINFGGSGAIDNIRYKHAVPEPTSLIAWSLLGLVFLGDRRNRIPS